ncbi:Na+/H+ antiporter subunit E [Paenibacillus camelliae]|uniref:Na+/H+ antiporter subunit E n=1 Tax=Paenibacillus camelliae TaxID=512410 RepID=UPI002040C8C2|nr:Na+/H+ antiporter subunit E [Paenibacillus camelliae]MCM3634188.1 Na+/H+ antiporter subunit E [Paenibacillus camelliae]
MTTQILINLLIAITWMLLNENWDVVSFTVGYVIGFAIISSMRRFFPVPFYGKKAIAVIKLLLLFIIELFKSSITVIKEIMRPKIKIKPGIFRTTTVLESDLEISLLVTLITLTPGSVVMEIDQKARVLFIHAMDADDFNNNIMKTKKRFEKAIIEVMR